VSDENIDQFMAVDTSARPDNRKHADISAAGYLCTVATVAAFELEA
jgi:hypothetical protein